VSPEWFETAIPPSEQPQKSHALDRAATGIGRYLYSSSNTVITSQAGILHCVLTGALVGWWVVLGVLWPTMATYGVEVQLLQVAEFV